LVGVTAAAPPAFAGPAKKFVAIDRTPDGHGYWLVDSAGAVDAFGDAGFYGSLSGGGSTVMGLEPTPDGHGYWLFTKTGSVQGFGDAVFYGDLATTNVTGMAVTADGGGYWSYNQNLWMHHLTGGATYLPL
jgi:hypothetical protein